MSEIHGECHPRFEAVRQTFQDNFVHRHELGAAFCVYHQGEKVVDVWGGYLDADQNRYWQSDTRCSVFSVTKGVVAICLHRMHEQGLLDFDRPIQCDWPEFRHPEITWRMFLNHRSGLCAVDTPIGLEALKTWDIAEALLRQEPLWEPDTDQGYHTTSFGLYLGYLFQRLLGEDIGAFIDRELAKPLGLNLSLGRRPDASEAIAQVVKPSLARALRHVVPTMLIGVSAEAELYRAALQPRSETARAFGNPASLGRKGIFRYNQAEIQALPLPWANLLSDARSLAKLYSPLANGGTDAHPDGVLSQASIASVSKRQSFSEHDRVLRKPVGYSLGFLKENHDVFHSSESAFGFTGTGGALGWCDPEAQISTGYVMNRMTHQIRSFRSRSLMHAVYRCL